MLLHCNVGVSEQTTGYFAKIIFLSIYDNLLDFNDSSYMLCFMNITCDNKFADCVNAIVSFTAAFSVAY